MDKELGKLVRSRARDCCEYCQRPRTFANLTFPIDHVIARQHGGKTVESNLALACGICNRHKGPNIAGLDPHTAKLTRLFHPRNDAWTEHFRWNGPFAIGLTDVGRTTVVVLALNNPLQIAIRQGLIAERRVPS